MKRPKDPHAAREAEKYQNPIPSREFILQQLNSATKPLSPHQISTLLGISDEQNWALSRRLKAMEREGQIMCTRRGDYAVVDKLALQRGYVTGHKDGFGFVRLLEGGDDLFLTARQMRRVFHGDLVLVREADELNRGKTQGVIVEVLERHTQSLVGRLHIEAGVNFVRPENRRLPHDVIIPQHACRGAKSGQYVVVAIEQQPSANNPPSGKIEEILGDHMAPGMEIDVAIRNFEIPYEWPRTVIRDSRRFANQGISLNNRVDLRSLPLVTIDGEDARDFDDAVYAESKTLGGWRLYVAIADVSHYVEVDGALDVEAQNRATSVYFPRQVIPMLPEVLSNGLCSLMPEQDRYCMVCEMTISGSGKLSGYKFYEAVMHSHARLTYEQVHTLLAAKEDVDEVQRKALETQFKPLLPHLKQLNKLHKTLRKTRKKRGALDFSTSETRIIYDDQNRIQQIVPTQQLSSHQLIEECMLCANVASAKFLAKHDLPGLYRVHAGPGAEKLTKLRSFLGELGLNLAGGEKPSPLDYSALLTKIGKREDAEILQTVLLRSLSQADYRVENEGHFGLAFDAYTHFTSPIRRYPDLLVHRAIKSIIYSRKSSKNVKRVKGAGLVPKSKLYPYSLEQLVTLSEHCSMAERRADDASRDVTDWLKCEYMQDRVGQYFKGKVVAVTGFGLFVQLHEQFVEGLVHITALPKDYYHFDAAKYRLVGEHSRKSFRLGDQLEVQVVRVDIDERKIDFELVDKSVKKRSDKASKKPRKGKPKRRRKS